MTPNFDVFRLSLYLNHLTAQLLMFGLLYFGSPGKITANLNCSLARVSQSECIDLGRLHSVLKDTKYDIRQDLLCDPIDSKSSFFLQSPITYSHISALLNWISYRIFALTGQWLYASKCVWPTHTLL